MLRWLRRRIGSRPETVGRADSTREVGRRSERVARAFLKRAGFSIIAANFRCPMGEVDLIAQAPGRGGPLVFVEVKSRVLSGSGETPLPESAVNRDKQKRIGRVAKYFCRTRKKYRDRRVRFDVIGSDWPAEGDDGEGRPVIRHHEAAFRPES